MANPYNSIGTRANGQVIQATWFNTIKTTLVNNGAVKHKIDATTAPGVSDDDSQNYEPGSTWVDVTNDKFYVCVDASTGAAVWYELADTSTSQTFTNKTLTSPAINGSNLNYGTASNTNRLLLPSDTTTNLDLLTDVAGLIAYDTTTNEVAYNTGSGWVNIGQGLIDPMTTDGDLITQSSSSPARVALGTTNQVLYSNGTLPAWGFDIKDEDDMSSDSATALATQQSIKAYVDNENKSWYAFYDAGTAGQTITTGITILDFGTLVVDDDSSVTTGAAWKYTVQTGAAGIFDISTNVQMTGASYTAGQKILIDIYKNGVFLKRICENVVYATGSFDNSLGNSISLRLADADYIDLRATSTGASRNILAVMGYSWITIKRTND